MFEIITYAIAVLFLVQINDLMAAERSLNMIAKALESQYNSQCPYWQSLIEEGQIENSIRW